MGVAAYNKVKGRRNKIAGMKSPLSLPLARCIPQEETGKGMEARSGTNLSSLMASSSATWSSSTDEVSSPPAAALELRSKKLLESSRLQSDDEGLAKPIFGNFEAPDAPLPGRFGIRPHTLGDPNPWAPAKSRSVAAKQAHAPADLIFSRQLGVVGLQPTFDSPIR